MTNKETIVRMAIDLMRIERETLSAYLTGGFYSTSPDRKSFECYIKKIEEQLQPSVEVTLSDEFKESLKEMIDVKIKELNEN